MHCSATFFAEDFLGAHGPFSRHASFSYRIVTDEQSIIGNPTEKAAESYADQIDSVPSAATVLPAPELGPDAHYWYQEQTPSGAHATSLQHNLIVQVIVDGKDRNENGEEEPMTTAEAEREARKLAEAMIENL
ncbi:hypothetical protein [Actinoalloteichus sp. GBA129-24]|uniref:hypothetical protein n=1 Tax=Actinoalloteichus sp. GBA129-24 TaxID=1612551 RepID=UPI0012F95E29|nr:hypothetical protein [Actinoalloteichus sp. GBA129-24]